MNERVFLLENDRGSLHELSDDEAQHIPHFPSPPSLRILVGMLPLSQNILITGMQGSGKSYLAKKSAEAGYKTVDADTIDGLSAWHDAAGHVVAFDAAGNQDWLDTHQFLWDRDVLRTYLETHGPIIFCGSSGNTMDMLDLFDQAFYLKVPTEIIMQRLTAHDRENSFGSTLEQQATIAARVTGSDNLMNTYPITTVDGTQSPEVLLKKILESF